MEKEKGATDFNSTKNQEIKSKFVGIHVYAQVNALVEFSLQEGWENSDAPISWEDIENIWEFPEWHEKIGDDNLDFYGGIHEEHEKFKEEFTKLRQRNDDRLDEELIDDDRWGEIASEIDDAESDFETLDTEMQEPLEWWLVSNFLARKLNEKGHPNFEDIWGRTTSGQAILLDHVISEICWDMEILEGQSNEWKT